MSTAPQHVALGQILAHVFTKDHDALRARLRRAFPCDPDESVEDALSEALLSLLSSLESPSPYAAGVWSHQGSAGLQRLLYTVAWRQLRGQHRSSRARHEQPLAALPERAGGADPHAALLARQASEAIAALLPQAARRFAPRGAAALESALEDRLSSGDSDLCVASRHAIDRSALCRARGWLETRVAS